MSLAVVGNDHLVRLRQAIKISNSNSHRHTLWDTQYTDSASLYIHHHPATAIMTPLYTWPYKKL